MAVTSPTPGPRPMSGRNIAIATAAASAFGYYMYTRSRAKNARLIQPEEHSRYQNVGQPQTVEGGAKAATAKDIPRSGGGGER
ncbi:hypothetical protein AJ79_04338 [Helicocarpus griseus UAMH5409]|uniref:Uncharacterized protein n=1 Tax=Helicocarpus griseus UAMH5409 TaxID=1447875 RepID=A0A2B7XTS8_9EURO|nr:hypothetical protein AJ79_04338 [Helicocarpus griseus UAMH5409]